MEKRPILIIGALNSELNYLISKLENCKQEVNCVYKFFIRGYGNDKNTTGID